MKTLRWPESGVPCYFRCSICDVLIMPEINHDGKTQWYTPNSRYWNCDKLQIYCGVVCLYKK